LTVKNTKLSFEYFQLIDHIDQMITISVITLSGFRCTMFKYLILLFFILAVASCVDTNLNESEKAFESEFNKLYGDKDDEKKAAKALADAEKQVIIVFFI
jgi:hypothetical protein